MEEKKDLIQEEDFSIQKLMSNPKFLYGVAALFSLVLIMFCADSYNAIQKQKELDSLKLDLASVTQQQESPGMTAEEFKVHLIKLGIQEDLKKGVTVKAELIKLRLFGII